MKKVFSFLLVLALCLSASAQYKVLESSQKKAPEWVNSLEPGFLIVTVFGKDMPDCQERAQTEISERIIRAIASNVQSTVTNTSSEVTTNAGVQSEDIYKSVTKIRSANLPFLKGVSLSKAVASYWEKQQEKSTGKIQIAFSVKYPFNDMQLKNLIAEYEALEYEKAKELKDLENAIGSIEKVSEIKQGILKLMALKEFFVDGLHLSQVDAVIKQYQSLYSLLTIATTFSGDGECVVQLLLNGNPISVGVAPRIKGSECISNIDIKAQDGTFVVSYDNQDCLDEDENYLDVSFAVEGKTIKKRAPLTHKNGGANSASKFSVIPEGKVYLQAETSTGSSVTNVSIRISLNNRGGMPFGLKSIELEVPELTAPIVFDDIDKGYKTKGVVQIKALAEGTFSAREVRSSSLNYVKGSAVILNPATNTLETVKINLPYSTNWGK